MFRQSLKHFGKSQLLQLTNKSENSEEDRSMRTDLSNSIPSKEKESGGDIKFNSLALNVFKNVNPEDVNVQLSGSGSEKYNTETQDEVERFTFHHTGLDKSPAIRQLPQVTVIQKIKIFFYRKKNIILLKNFYLHPKPSAFLLGEFFAECGKFFLPSNKMTSHTLLSKLANRTEI